MQFMIKAKSTYPRGQNLKRHKKSLLCQKDVLFLQRRNVVAHTAIRVTCDSCTLGRKYCFSPLILLMLFLKVIIASLYADIGQSHLKQKG